MRKSAKPKPTVDLVRMDSIDFMCRAVDIGVPVQKPKIIIADPPYNFGEPYDEYHDNRPARDYLAWTERWLHAAKDFLDPFGSLWVFIPDEWEADVQMMARKLELHKRDHIIWAFTFGEAQQKRFTRSHQHILCFTRHKTKNYFDGTAVRVPSARQLVYKDKRANPKGKMPDDVWILLKEQMEAVLTPDQDVWLVSRVCGTYKERHKHVPNQIPVAIMERIVRYAAPKGSLLFDPFCGTGSSGVAALEWGCNYLACDISKASIAKSRIRLNEVLKTLA